MGSGDSIALLQTEVSGRDGRSRVAAELVETLNDLGSTPVLYTQAHHDKVEGFRQGFGKSLAFELRKLSAPRLRRWGAVKMALANLQVWGRLYDFDTVWNLNSNPYLLPPGPRYVHYVHFPVEAAFDFHVKFERPPMSIYAAGLRSYYRGVGTVVPVARRFRDLFLANSGFTADKMAEYWRIPRERIHVVFPPCDFVEDARFVGHRACICVGAFSDEKRQLDQIDIAARLPEIAFHLVGRVDHSPGYYRQCVAKAESLRLSNVTFHTDLDHEGLTELYGQCSIALHNKEYEHFGIAVVEALSHGCIPFVHDSGGPREIVADARCRFRDVPEAVERIRDFAWDEGEALHGALTSSLERFSAAAFRRAVEPIVEWTSRGRAGS